LGLSWRYSPDYATGILGAVYPCPLMGVLLRKGWLKEARLMANSRFVLGIEFGAVVVFCLPQPYDDLTWHSVITCFWARAFIALHVGVVQ